MGRDTTIPSRERILQHLKTRGPQTSAELARRLEMTSMGARQHLAQLERQDLVRFEERRGRVGRPERVWRLTEAGHGRFPQGYADLTLEFLESLRSAFGPEGLERLIEERTRRQLERYQEQLPAGDTPLAGRVAALARLRSEEGYMAEWRRHRDGSLTLLENHCPICAAATACQGLCRGELELFQAALGDDVTVERSEHLLAGARRCAYRIRPRPGRRNPV